MKKFFTEHKTLSIVIAACAGVVLAALVAVLIVFGVRNRTDKGDVNSTDSTSSVSSVISVPDIEDGKDNAASELLPDSDNYISPDEGLVSSNSASTASGTSSTAPKKTERPSAPTDKNGTTASQGVTSSAAPSQPTTPTTPAQQPGLSESTNKPLNEWQFDEDSIKNAPCGCCGLSVVDGSCDGNYEVTERTENGKNIITMRCKNKEIVEVF